MLRSLRLDLVVWVRNRRLCVAEHWLSHCVGSMAGLFSRCRASRLCASDTAAGCHRSVYLLTADAGVVRMSTYRVMGRRRRTRKVRGDLPQTTGVSDRPSIWLSFRLLFVPSGGVPATR